MSENQLRETMCELARSLYDRGLAHGSTGNISARTDDGHIQLVAGCVKAAQYAAGQNGQPDSRGRRGFQELSSGDGLSGRTLVAPFDG